MSSARRRRGHVIDVSQEALGENREFTKLHAARVPLSSALQQCFAATAVLLLLVSLATSHFYRLPVARPVDAPAVQFSEARALLHLRQMSSVIGKSWAGTQANADVAQYIEAQLTALQSSALKRRAANPLVPHFELDVQSTTGTMEFDILGGRMTNMFNGLVNVVCRLHFGPQPDASAPAILINSHFDSPLESDGAMDSRAPISVMLEMVRALLHTDDATLQKMNDNNVALVFLFNGGEEVLQMASKGFVSQHRWAKHLKTVVNMDAVGAQGPEVLFQNGGLRWVEAFARAAPFPHGTSIADDFFASGIVQSDTDYRIFAKYGNITGIDLAFYQDSYAYHTGLDTMDRMSPGSLQHEGTNVLAYLRSVLTSDLLLTEAPSKQAPVYFDVLQFVMICYSRRFAVILHAIILAFVAFVVQTGKYEWSFSRMYVNFFGCLICPTILGIGLSLFAPLMWFARPELLIPLFGFPTLSFVFWFVEAYAPKRRKPVSYARNLVADQAVLYASLTLLLTAGGVGSAYTTAFMSMAYAVTLLLDRMTSKNLTDETPMSFVHMCVPIVTMTIFIIPVALGPIDMLAPLFGRLGNIPADAVMGFVISLAGLFHFLSLYGPLAAQIGHAKTLFRLSSVGTVLTVVLMLLTLKDHPYTKDRPKRIFLQHAVRTTPSLLVESSILNEGPKIFLALADPGPSIPLLNDILENAKNLPASSKLRSAVKDLALLTTDQISDAFSAWKEPLDFDGIFPFNYFLTGYVIPADEIPIQEPPSVKLLESSFDEAKNATTRRVAISYVGFEITTFRFKTDLLWWDVLPHVPEKDRGWYVGRAVAGRAGLKHDIQLTMRSAGKASIPFQLSAVRFTQTEFFQDFLSLFPDYTTLVGFTSVYESIVIE